ncbi:MAG: hypothetical protein SOV54_08585 [Faecalibacterium prausnitzii]|nr:hypothetical protein [Faecalibacterium prausnitzii]
MKSVESAAGTFKVLRVAFADFSAAPWQGLEKSERCPNNSSLLQPQAAVVVVAVRVPLGILQKKKSAVANATAGQAIPG